MQTEVNEARGLTFAKAARHLLRQDPQVLVLGEIRDEETANIVVRASLTGHMVIATLHAGSCQGVFERLLVLTQDAYSAVSAVDLVLNQRLVRRLCPDCQGAGCARCLATGYRGRAPLVEWIKIDEPLRSRVRAEGPSVIAPEHSLLAAARELLLQKRSDEKELRRVLGGVFSSVMVSRKAMWTEVQPPSVDRVRLIRRGMRCFVFGAIGLIPILGSGLAIQALRLRAGIKAGLGEGRTFPRSTFTGWAG